MNKDIIITYSITLSHIIKDLCISFHLQMRLSQENDNNSMTNVLAIKQCTLSLIKDTVFSHFMRTFLLCALMMLICYDKYRQ